MDRKTVSQLGIIALVLVLGVAIWIIFIQRQKIDKLQAQLATSNVIPTESDADPDRSKVIEEMAKFHWTHQISLRRWFAARQKWVDSEKSNHDESWATTHAEQDKEFLAHVSAMTPDQIQAVFK